MADMRAKYETLSLLDLKEIAKGRKIKVTGLKKEDLIEKMLEMDEADAKNGKPVEAKGVMNVGTGMTPEEEREMAELDSGIRANGIIEVMPDGFGFIRCENYLPGEQDVYVAPSQIRRFNLKTGDIVEGNTRIKTQQEKFSALLYVSRVNGMAPELALNRSDSYFPG